MKKIILLFILLFAVSYTLIKAQDGAQFPDVSGKITGKYEKLSLNTGAVSMSVPIWTAVQYGLSIPITVSFNGNGIKKTDIYSLLGPWNLNIGGSVSVEQRGLYDREDSGSPILGNGFYYSGNLVDDIHLNLDFALFSVHKQDNKFSDTEPDIFYFNFPGGSGKFVYNNSGQIINLTDKSVIISYEPNGNGILDDKIYITNNNGIKYFYKCTGYSKNKGITDQPFFSLYKAEDLNSDNFIEISFQASDTMFVSENDLKVKYNDNCENQTIYYNNQTVRDSTYRTFVKMIETNTSKTEFVYLLQNGNSDENLIITVSLKKDGSFRPYKRYRFIKGAKNGNVLSRIIQEYNTDYNSDNSGITWETNDKGYSFKYSGGGLEGGVDFWGYNNGKTNDIENLETYQSSESSVVQLKKITFPKGNSINYEFNLNHFSSFRKFSYHSGAGLRVKKIIEQDEHKNITGITEYGYSDGKLTSPPYHQTEYQYTVQRINDDPILGYLDMTSSFPVMTGESYVNYSNVIEYVGGKDINTGSGKNGRIEYTFKNETSADFENYTEEPSIKDLFGILGNFPNENVCKTAWNYLETGLLVSLEYKFPYKIWIDKADINGLLEKKTVFDNLNRKISETEYQYSVSEKPVSTGLKIYDFYPSSYCYNNFPGDGTYYHGITFYKLSKYKVKLTNETSMLFDKNDETKVNKSQTTFEYSEDTDGDLIINMPIKKQTTLSNGDTVRVRDYYPHNYTEQSDILNLMNARNVKTELIKTETYKNNELISGQNTTYGFKQIGSKQVIVPDSSQVLEEGEYKTVKWFDKYDDKIRLTESHGIDSIHNSVIYNVLGMPIAKALNAGSNQIYHTSFEETDGNYTLSAYSGKKAHDGSYQFTLPETAGTYTLSYRKFTDGKWNYVSAEITNPGNGSNYTVNDGIIDELRVYPTDALMSTNTSVPGIGMTSETDGNGLSTYYDYDKFGRLIKIFNQDHKLIKENQYHEANLTDLFLNPLTYTTEIINDKTFITVHPTVSGGNPSYTYNWVISPTPPVTPAHLNFIKVLIEPNILYEITCTVTDTDNNTVTKVLKVKISE